jgi:hypothetical protein
MDRQEKEMSPSARDENLVHAYLIGLSYIGLSFILVYLIGLSYWFTTRRRSFLSHHKGAGMVLPVSSRLV